MTHQVQEGIRGNLPSRQIFLFCWRGWRVTEEKPQERRKTYMESHFPFAGLININAAFHVFSLAILSTDDDEIFDIQQPAIVMKEIM